MGFFSDIFGGSSAGGSSPGIETKEIVDPLKKNVATPLSKFLASAVGKGTASFPGDVTTPIDPLAENAFTGFLGLDVGELFDRAVSDPTLRTFKKDIVPLLTEGFAGSLRGSGRFRSVEDASTDLLSNLAAQRAQFEATIPQQQFQLGLAKQSVDAQNKALEFNEWVRTQPEFNPLLDKALAFLAQSTSSGTDVLAAMNPGQQGWLPQLLGAGVSAAGSIVGGKIAAGL